MIINTISNPERGCGTLKEGGFYARGDLGNDSNLSTWTWTLGDGIMGGNNYAIEATPRQMQLINLPSTLDVGRAVYEPDGLPLTVPGDHALRQLPDIAMLDHVGSSFYTPWSFAGEAMAEGPSRKIPPQIAKIIAPYTPMPILFTHSWMPMVDPSRLDELIEWTELDPDFSYFGRTPDIPGWGLGAQDDHGIDHWFTTILVMMHSVKGKVTELSRVMPTPLCEDVLTVEQVFGLSWITRVIYIAPEEADEDDLYPILMDGIHPVRLEK